MPPLKSYKLLLFVGVLFLTFSPGWSLEAGDAISIPLIDTPPTIDGKLDEPVWETAARFQAFYTFKPDYGKPGSEETVMYACSDQDNFYFAARCFEKDTSKIKANITNRDNMFGDDWVAFCIDTFNDFQSAYGFLVNPLGIQGDGILNSNGDLDGSHDMVWFSKGTVNENGYTVEIKVPFKSIRFPVKKEVKMGIWLVRNIVRTSENVCFPGLSPTKGAILSQTQPILVSGMKYKGVTELLPAVTLSRSRGRQQGTWGESEGLTDFSLTGKLGLTPSLVLDATYNPDFSQVEADAGQVDVNLRYAIYYQEKRPFFLEGLDEFKFAGNTEEAPLYAVVHTRNIIDPILGLKLTGKLGRKNSIATIIAIDEPLEVNGKADSGHPVFGILRFRHALKKDSFIGAFYTGREVSGTYNRVLGIDGRIRLTGAASTEYHLLGSFTHKENEEANSGHALGFRYEYSNRNVAVDIGLQDISRDFQVDTGFLTRKGLTRLAGFGMYRFYPKSTFFQTIDTFYWSYHILDKESDLFETLNLFTFRIRMPRTSMARIDLFLANEVFAGQRFDTSAVRFVGESQITRQLYLSIFYRYGNNIYYDPENPFPGRSNSLSVGLDYQPLEKFTTSLSFDYEDFYRRSDSHKEYDYTILRSRTTFQLNKYLFFRGIAEYNFFREKLSLDFLTSFTYIPGTVVHIGYGTVLEKNRWDGNMGDYVPVSRFQETHRAFFFKVSYLWRL